MHAQAGRCARPRPSLELIIIIKEHRMSASRRYMRQQRTISACSDHVVALSIDGDGGDHSAVAQHTHQRLGHIGVPEGHRSYNAGHE